MCTVVHFGIIYDTAVTKQRTIAARSARRGLSSALAVARERHVMLSRPAARPAVTHCTKYAYAAIAAVPDSIIASDLKRWIPRGAAWPGATG